MAELPVGKAAAHGRVAPGSHLGLHQCGLGEPCARAREQVPQCAGHVAMHVLYFADFPHIDTLFCGYSVIFIVPSKRNEEVQIFRVCQLGQLPGFRRTQHHWFFTHYVEPTFERGMCMFKMQVMRRTNNYPIQIFEVQKIFVVLGAERDRETILKIAKLFLA